jgi:hypothetical protein
MLALIFFRRYENFARSLDISVLDDPHPGLSWSLPGSTLLYSDA